MYIQAEKENNQVKTPCDQAASGRGRGRGRGRGSHAQGKPSPGRVPARRPRRETWQRDRSAGRRPGACCRATGRAGVRRVCAGGRSPAQLPARLRFQAPRQTSSRCPSGRNLSQRRQRDVAARHLAREGPPDLRARRPLPRRPARCTPAPRPGPGPDQPGRVGSEQPASPPAGPTPGDTSAQRPHVPAAGKRGPSIRALRVPGVPVHRRCCVAAVRRRPIPDLHGIAGEGEPGPCPQLEAEVCNAQPGRQSCASWKAWAAPPSSLKIGSADFCVFLQRKSTCPLSLK
ncbi:uncharacterized protein [Saccopteryx bilineata]|uniref:uncharacterized protein n=1 Tax=Saccopteryx bilineata TaxID=59482 RepID=UPI0033904C06